MQKHNLQEDARSGYERSDAKAGTIFKFALGLIAIAVVVHVLMWVMFVHFQQREAQKDPQLSPLAPRERQLPPEPRLQAMEGEAKAKATQPFDLPNLRQVQQNEEDSVLGSYGWIDQQSGIARIPVRQAMKLLLERKALKITEEENPK